MTSYAFANESSSPPPSSSSSSPPAAAAAAPTTTTAATIGATTSTTGETEQIHHQHRQQCQEHSPTFQSTDNYVTKTTKLVNSSMQDEPEHHLHHLDIDQQRRRGDLSDCDCDCDSLSDGGEKADTTPENIKKIDDDIIEFELELERTKQQQQQHNSSSTMNNAGSVNNNNNVSGLGGGTVDVDTFTGSTSCIGYSGAVGGGGGGTASTASKADTLLDESNAKFCFVENPNPENEKDSLLMERRRKSNSNSNSSSSSNTPLSPISKHQDQQSSTTATAATTPIALQKAEEAFDEGSSASNTTTTATTTATTTTTKEESEIDGGNSGNSKRSFAFTFNFDSNDSNAAAATAARYKSVMERFQNRHRRGASMSKLDSDGGGGGGGGGVGDATMTSSLTGDGLSLSSSASASPLTLRSATKQQQKSADVSVDSTSTTKVKLRPRDRSTSRVRDAAKRHSWSPRSSTNELSTAPPPQQSTNVRYGGGGDTAPAQHQNKNRQQQQQQQQRPPTSKRVGVKSNKPLPPPLVMPKVGAGGVGGGGGGGANMIANRTPQFTPRSKAMQLAFQKIDFLCSQAPLVDFAHTDGDGDGDEVSEAGTYTLDGDNYTEEQKDLMNIDKSSRSGGRRQQQHKHHHAHERAHHIKHNAPPISTMDDGCGGGVTTITKIPVRTSNVLEVNYFYNDADNLDADHHTGQHPDHHDDYYEISQQQQQQQQQQQIKLKSKSNNVADDFILGNHQSAGAFLEKIKSRVLRNAKNAKSSAAAMTNVITETVNPPLLHSPPPLAPDEEDIGCFTSVTTSGVLAKQSSLDPRPKVTRKSSLSTSQIDSSEYVSNDVKLKSVTKNNNAASTCGGGGGNGVGGVGGSYTDIQKAEYRLNFFTNHKDLQKYAATRNLIETPPETPISTTDKLPSDTAALQMAQTKNDWIQQWARNARARSLASDVSRLQQQQQQQQQLQQHPQKSISMTRSYNCSGGGGGGCNSGASLTDDSLYSHQLNGRYRALPPAASDNEFDYSSDPSLLTSVAYAKSQQQQHEQAQQQHDGSSNAASVKPPISPSKIPSPLHSIGRTRSASRTRGSLQGLIAAHDQQSPADIDDDAGQDIYLQKTAAAINSLQQSLSRKNSLKSPTGSSPRMMVAASRNQHHEDGDSPQRSIESDGLQTHRHRHRRNLSNDSYATAAAQAQAQLMTSSFNEQQLQLLTSGEYLIKQMRMRKNSFDGNICSPGRRRTMERAPENNALSPLHRGGSFSMKIAAGSRTARSQYQNIYTPPSARQAYIPLHQQQQQQQQQKMTQILMKKSASSNNFGQAYSDYDDNLEYYINDADDDDDDDIGIDDDDDDDLQYEREYLDEYEGDANEEYGPRTITLQAATIEDTPALAPLTSTRYNKALLMRIERSKQRVAAAGGGATSKPSSAPSAGTKNALNNVAGLVACPNTPELPRRNVKSAPRASLGTVARQSVPRDTSLSRLASQVPNSLASAKKQLLQTAAAAAAVVPLTSRSSSGSGQRVQPKYMDISKYKPAQGNAFLRKNEAKSTLKAPLDGSGGIKRSPSSSGLSRADPTRASNRSIRSTMTSSCTGSLGGGGAHSGNISANLSSRASSAVRRDDSVTKQKEIEMAMWKRRSTYDPLKAAAEDRRRKEEAKRLAAMAKNNNEVLCGESTNSEGQ